MKSLNFEFLRTKRPVLADLAGFAENYAHTDPASSLLKQRGFLEHLVFAVYEAYRLPQVIGGGLYELMEANAFRQTVPEVVMQKLHAVRIAGNHAAHPRRAITGEMALDHLVRLHDLAQWFHLQVDRGTKADCSKYAPPPSAAPTNEKAKETLEKLRLAESRYAGVLAQLEEKRKKLAEAEQLVALSQEDNAKLKAAGQEVAKALAFDEHTTRRRLIDELLVQAGWDVGLRGQDTETVRQEVPLSAVTGPKDEGYADYVLYGDNGKPLAVVEAKKAAKDPKVGAEQARLYALALEKKTGQRPAIFYTNGFEIYLWDDVQKYPQRKVRGFYSKDSLEYLQYQRKNRKPLQTVAPNLSIAERMYQLEAVKRVCERFTDNHRRALIVQATGTGKTRVAASLVDVLMRAGWAKRILFLCDRKELRKQADNVFKEFLPGEPRIIVSRATSSDRDKRIYLATYPAMMECYEDFDVGFFDLIVADESHRSIYGYFRALFQHFDALQIGLTATPVNLIERNTYALFGCVDRDPTVHFGFTEAINHNPPFLVPFRVRTFGSQLRKEGIRYGKMSDAQRKEAEEQEETPQALNYTPEDLDRIVFNKDNTRNIWRSLMDEGIRDATGSQIGKTIVFARNHNHAMHMAEVFNEIYPNLGGLFCRVIDNQEPRAEQLIDNLKDKKNELTIAISVDMLDTGLDVPEVVNLVLAKPVKSYVKFWQMLGRGTRLCKNLFGPGKDKSEFLVFDHWSNFWFFEEKYTEPPNTQPKSLLQQLFEERVALATTAIDKMNDPALQSAVDLILEDINAVRATGAIDVKDRWKELEGLADRNRIEHMDAATKALLQTVAGPLMRWRNVRGDEDAYRFDLLVTKLQKEVVRGGVNASRVKDLRARVENSVELLMKNQNPVKAKVAAIQQVRDPAFWAGVTPAGLEGIRLQLRGIMKYQQETGPGGAAPHTLDITDEHYIGKAHLPKLEGLELVEYRRRVEAVLQEKFSTDPVLQRVRAGQPVTEEELEHLARAVLQVDELANIKHLAAHRPATRQSLLAVFRSLVGMDAAAVEKAFQGFTHKHPALSAQQLRFLQVLQNHIAKNGGIEIDRLYEAPFTDIHADSVDGVFQDAGQVNDIISIIETFEPKSATA